MRASLIIQKVTLTVVAAKNSAFLQSGVEKLTLPGNAGTEHIMHFLTILFEALAGLPVMTRSKEAMRLTMTLEHKLGNGICLSDYTAVSSCARVLLLSEGRSPIL